MQKRDLTSFEAFFTPRRAALAAVALSVLLAGCGDGGSGTGGAGGTGAAGGTGGTGAAGGTGGAPGCIAPGADDQKTVQKALIEVKDGATICFTEGTFHFQTELELDAKNVTIQGAGQD